MRRNIAEWRIEDIHKKREIISFPDYQREPKLWSPKDKELLIDSILEEVDIPSLYFYRIPSREEYEVVDGQQRLWAIWGYLDDEFACRIKGRTRRFSELDEGERKKILNYKMHVTVLSDVSEDYLRKLFIRLQLGLLLNTGEKLHATSGELRDFVFRTFVKHPFIRRVRIPERRYAKETLCAQICINSFSRARFGSFSRTRFEDLSAFFQEYANPAGGDKQVFQEQCKHVLDICGFLDDNFKDRANVLRNRSFILSVYLFADEAYGMGSKQERDRTMKKFVDFVIKLLRRLKEEAEAGIKRSNEELYVFQSYLSISPGEKHQIERRQIKLKELFDYYVDRSKIKGD